MITYKSTTSVFSFIHQKVSSTLSFLLFSIVVHSFPNNQWKNQPSPSFLFMWQVSVWLSLSWRQKQSTFTIPNSDTPIQMSSQAVISSDSKDKRPARPARSFLNRCKKSRALTSRSTNATTTPSSRVCLSRSIPMMRTSRRARWKASWIVPMSNTFRPSERCLVLRWNWSRRARTKSPSCLITWLKSTLCTVSSRTRARVSWSAF